MHFIALHNTPNWGINISVETMRSQQNWRKKNGLYSFSLVVTTNSETGTFTI